MARITVKDLPQSDVLDRQAMLSIKGGSRSGARPIPAQGAHEARDRLVDYPPGFGARSAGPAGTGRS